MYGPGRTTILSAYLIYGLHLFSAINGLLSPAFIVTTFLTGWPSILGIILTYLKREDARGSYLESHYEWLLSTFWGAFVWILISVALVFTIIGMVFIYPLLLLVGVWVLYRLGTGVMRLLDQRPIS